MTVRPDATAEQSVLREIDEDRLVQTLRDLVSIPSVDGTPAECDVQRWCADRLTELGLTVDCWDIDVEEARRVTDFPGMEVSRSQAVGCVGVLGDLDQVPALALYGHTDVVPPGDLAAWSGRDPFDLRVDDGIAWGRGACDMKGGVAAILEAVSAVRRSGITLSKPFAIHLVSAEEDGGLGAFATLRRGHRAGACVSAEPTAGDVVPANAGSLTFRLEVAGRSTHGATRGRGVSAIERFELVHAALRRLDQRRNATSAPFFEHLDLPWPLSVGVVHAGDWASTVPDRLTAQGRYGVRVDETVEHAIAEFEQTVATVWAADPWLRDHPVHVSWPGGRFAPGRLPVGHPLLDIVSAAAEDVTGRHPAALGAPYGSDLRHYVGAGIPTVQYGPGQVAHAHASDEQVAVADVVASARVYASLIVRLCAAAERLSG
jgi:acetylornithine deacetylase